MLIVLATDGYDREDGSVYYSTYLVVEVSQSRESEVLDVLEGNTDGLSQKKIVALIEGAGFSVKEVQPNVTVYSGES